MRLTRRDLGLGVAGAGFMIGRARAADVVKVGVFPVSSSLPF